jgi:hypothetical protein
MLTPIAYGLAIALDLLILLIGGRFLIAPRAAAAGYGVPAKPGGDPAYLTIKGLRDGTYAQGPPPSASTSPPPCWSCSAPRCCSPADTKKGNDDMITLSHVLCVTLVLH